MLATRTLHQESREPGKLWLGRQSDVLSNVDFLYSVLISDCKRPRRADVSATHRKIRAQRVDLHYTAQRMKRPSGCPCGLPVI